MRLDQAPDLIILTASEVLDILVQSKRDAKAARRFLAKLMKKQ
jgi:transposase-like protein